MDILGVVLCDTENETREGRAKITTKGRRKSKRSTEGIKNCPELTPYCFVWARPFQEYMEF